MRKKINLQIRNNLREISLTKSDLIFKIVQKYSFLYQKDVHKIVNIIFGTVSEAINNGDRVELRGFGAFSSKHRDARIGRNPKTGKPVAIPSKKLPFFKMGKAMKERINS